MKLALIAFLTLTLTAVLALANVNSPGATNGPKEAAQLSGAITVKGLVDRIEILRDPYGVPHVRATNEPDAHFGLGFVHAQDRLWQMEFQRRVGNGQLAEILGHAGLPTDKLFRTLGLNRSAAAAWARFTTEERKPVEAYLAGVNAFIASRPANQLPREFQILGIAPEPFRPEDVLVWGKVVAWGIGSNWDKELLRVRIASKLGPERAAQLMPAYTADGPTILPSKPDMTDSARGAAEIRGAESLELDPSIVDGLLELNRKVEELTGLGADGFGSNSWVLSGSRTTTGRPLLANDPHLASQTPAIWYIARVSGGALDVTGATIPGGPGVFIGHNGQISWGITTLNVDSQDIYVEHVNEQNEVEFEGAWESLRVVPETIKVKGQADTTLKVRISRHGPLISDLINPAGQPLAFRWTHNDPVDGGLLSTLGINRARNWKEFTEASRAHRPPDQNYVFADRQGNIGYIAAAAIPVRPDGDDGRVPVPGWTGQHEWRGYVPHDMLPRLFNPPQGYIVTANNKVSDHYPYLIGTNFAAPYRAARVVEMLEEKRLHSSADMERMQGDVFALHARELLPFMFKTVTADQLEQRAIQLLRGWDARVTGDSAAAAVFEAWYLKLGERLFADELSDPVAGDALWRTYSENIYFVGMALRTAIKEDPTWCDDAGTPLVETCADMFKASLTEGLNKMSEAQGTDDLTSWRWDRAHHALFPHSPFDANPQLKPIFSRSIPNGGDKFTVNVASVFLWDEYHQMHSAQYRQIVDFASLENSRVIIAPGQSGDPDSVHYDDLLERWQRVNYLPMLFGPRSIDGPMTERLVLEP
jgi:penicillin amidase